MIKKTLYFGNSAYLSLNLGQLFIKLPEVEKCNNLPESFKKQSIRQIPIEDIGIVVLDTLGIHHRNRYNAFCLADDIMEPYRPFVDVEVHKIYDEFNEENSLIKEIKVRLLSIPTLDVVIGGKRSPLMIAASTTTASLYKCFQGTSRRILYPSFP